MRDNEKVQQAEDVGATSPGEAAHPAISGPASGHSLRSFTLPDSAGQPVQLRQYLQRSNIVLFIYHGLSCPACGALLRELAAQREAYQQEETVVLAIGPDQPAENQQLATWLGHPFPLLSDPAGRISAQQGLDTPALIIADRWGEIWAAWAGGADHRLPSVQAIVEWLAFVEAQCEECTSIEWADEM